MPSRCSSPPRTQQGPRRRTKQREVALSRVSTTSRPRAMTVRSNRAWACRRGRGALRRGPSAAAVAEPAHRSGRPRQAMSRCPLGGSPRGRGERPSRPRRPTLEPNGRLSSRGYRVSTRRYPSIDSPSPCAIRQAQNHTATVHGKRHVAATTRRWRALMCSPPVRISCLLAQAPDEGASSSMS